MHQRSTRHAIKTACVGREYPQSLTTVAVIRIIMTPGSGGRGHSHQHSIGYRFADDLEVADHRPITVVYEFSPYLHGGPRSLRTAPLWNLSLVHVHHGSHRPQADSYRRTTLRHQQGVE